MKFKSKKYFKKDNIKNVDVSEYLTLKKCRLNF